MSSAPARTAMGALATVLVLLFLCAPRAEANYANGFYEYVSCITEASATTWRATFVATNTGDSDATLTGPNNYADTSSGASPGAPPTVLPAKTDVTWTTDPLPKSTASVTWHLATPNGPVASWTGSPRCFSAEVSTANPTVVGRLAVGQTVTAVGERERLNNQTYDESVVWIRDCNIDGRSVQVGTGRTYTIQPGDLNRRLQAAVTYSDPVTGDGSAAVSSCGSSATVRQAPANTAAPTVAGDPVVGGSLSIAGGTWTGTATLTQSVSWETCDLTSCTHVGDDATYTPVPADIGRTLRGIVSQTNTWGAASVVTAQTAPVRAAAPDAPADVSPAAIDFGDVAVGSSAPDRVVTYTNTASGPVTLQRIARGGGQLVDIGLPAAGRTCEVGLTLASGEACVLPIRFSPQATGERRATITIDDGQEHVVRLIGTGQPGPLLSVDTTPMDFGALQVGKYSAARTVRLTNDGDVGLLIAGVTSVSEFPTSTTCSDTTPLAPGDACSVSVKFHPRYAGARASTVTIRSNAAGGARYVDVAGVGT